LQASAMQTPPQVLPNVYWVQLKIPSQALQIRVTDPSNNKGIHSLRKTPPLPPLCSGLQFKLPKLGQKE